MLALRFLFLASAVVLVACSATASPGAADAAKGVCCPPASAPSCCMDYGGWSFNAMCGLKDCDGMPIPSDPGWKLGTDDHGCATWKNTSVGARVCGGQTPPDASAEPDSSADASGD